MTWLLDTNILAYALSDRGGVRDRINAASQKGRVATSILVVAELIYGVERSRRREANRGHVERALQSLDVIPVSRGGADRFGRIKAELHRNGISKGDIDLLLAASAIDLGATLVTHDQALLDGSIPDLLTEDWLVS